MARLRAFVLKDFRSYKQATLHLGSLTMLVLCQSRVDGESLMSLMRASAVVNCQRMPVGA